MGQGGGEEIPSADGLPKWLQWSELFQFSPWGILPTLKASVTALEEHFPGLGLWAVVGMATSHTTFLH